jgi:hypothetical protein
LKAFIVIYEAASSNGFTNPRIAHFRVIAAHPV